MRERQISERLSTPLGYVLVFALLAALTVTTVGLSFVPASNMIHLMLGQGIAVIKAALVVLVFMHALRGPAQTWAVIAVTAFWLVGVLLSLTLSDYFTRELLPYLPGH